MMKKGVSPVIATVLLIGMVVVIGMIVFMWFRGISEEAITKFDDQNVKVVCGEVLFDASYSGGYVYLSNTGNVPIYKIKARIVSPGSEDTFVLGDSSGAWDSAGLLQGGVYSEDLSGLISNPEKIYLTPVLAGKTDEGETRTHTCEERYAQEVLVD